ncbi:unannotated protein [freshwater metagenome]|uniref:Unannotated protein n=1 Tax=freshwater metagenome TaxID=449393 RepID=A0A6J6BJE4_9ZZZZ
MQLLVNESGCFGFWITLDETVCRTEQGNDGIKVAAELRTDVVESKRLFWPLVRGRTALPEVPKQLFNVGFIGYQFARLSELERKATNQLGFVSVHSGGGARGDEQLEQ